MADFFSGLDDIGGAVSDLFAAKGSQQAAGAYGTASKIALNNEELTKRSTAIQEQQQGIQTFKVLGSEQADVAGAGFSQGGSAGDLLRSSAQQAALSKQLIENQGEITAQGFEQQAAAYTGQEQAAQTQANAQKGAGAAKGVMGIIETGLSIASLFSDRRLKKDITLLRKQGEFNIYSFRYTGGDKTVWEGVMADEVEAIRPEAVTTLLGYKAVNYRMLGLEMVEHAR